MTKPTHRCKKCNETYEYRNASIVFKKKCPHCIIGELEKVDSKPEPLLTIELDDETSVPRVHYKGQELTGKASVFFDWDTDTDVMGGLTYAIEHYESGSYPVSNRI